jgi:hypothetical protein
MFSIYDWTQLRNLATDWISWFKRYISLSLEFAFYFHKAKTRLNTPKGRTHKNRERIGESLRSLRAFITKSHVSSTKTT